MRLALLAGLALCACAGYTHGDERFSYDGGPSASGGTDAGDAGTDAGTDAGADAGTDAGCTALSLNTTSIFDDCFLHIAATGSVSVDPSNCIVNINTGTGYFCTGRAAGPHDAFDGGCSNFACISSSLPGTILCVTGATTSCSIIVDGGP